MRGLTDDLRALVSHIEDALQPAVARTADRLIAIHPDLAPVAEQLTDFVLRGGKRLRPLFVLIGHRAAGGDADGPALQPALATELVHTCALIHDDIIDAAQTRRGGPSAHLALAGTTTEVADAQRFGQAAALLLGDLAHVVADELFLTSSAPPRRLLAALRVFTTMREELTAGQFLDVRAAFTRTSSTDQALTVASYKSGRYSVARPLELGATLAGDEQTAAGLAAAGLPLGQAFQIRDDILGVFGSHDETGKPTDSDLREGKRTLLVAAALRRLDDAQRTRFESLLGDPELSREAADELRGLIRDSGGLDATERRAHSLVDEFMARLADVPMASASRTMLEQLAAYLVTRHQ